MMMGGSMLFTQPKNDKPVKLLNSFYDPETHSDDKIVQQLDGSDLTYKWEKCINSTNMADTTKEGKEMKNGERVYTKG